jgi:hypothetical protein
VGIKLARLTNGATAKPQRAAELTSWSSGITGTLFSDFTFHMALASRSPEVSGKLLIFNGSLRPLVESAISTPSSISADEGSPATPGPQSPHAIHFISLAGLYSVHGNQFSLRNGRLSIGPKQLPIEVDARLSDAPQALYVRTAELLEGTAASANPSSQPPVGAANLTALPR